MSAEYEVASYVLDHAGASRLDAAANLAPIPLRLVHMADHARAERGPVCHFKRFGPKIMRRALSDA